MSKRINLKNWEKEDPARIKLTYEDDSVLYVGVGDFNRAFGCIISASKEAVETDFAIDPETLLYKEPKLKSWSVEGDKAKLVYTDDEVVFIPEETFKKSFCDIIIMPKVMVKKDYAI